jgi:hypothetical protein
LTREDGVQAAMLNVLVLATPLVLACGSETRIWNARGAPPDQDGVAWWSAHGVGSEIWLSQTGLYRDIAQKIVAAEMHEFQPAFELWSDGARKRRWLRLPPGTRIDNTEPDHWQFPVGSLLFKEFSQLGRRIETRVLARTGAGPNDYWMGAFAWNDDESDARFVSEGLANARGTAHDVPNSKQCGTCHNGEPGRVLGFSGIQQPGLSDELSSESVGAGPALTNSAAYRALGYLHANCAHCHNPRGSAYPDTDLVLRISVHDRTPDETPTYRTTLYKPPQYFKAGLVRWRVAPGAAGQSALVYRMRQTERTQRMPPFATEELDTAGIATVQTWIDSLASEPP